MAFEDLLNEQAICFRIRAGWKLEESEEGSALILKTDDGREVRVLEDASRYRAAVRRLTEGAPLRALWDSIAATGGEWHATAFSRKLHMLCRAGIIEFPLVEDAREQAVIAPQWNSYVPSLARRAPASGRGLDRFACLRRDGRTWLVESPLCGARLLVSDLEALELPLVRRALAAAGFLETAVPEDDTRRDILRQWEFHDLLFHAHHRKGWHHDMSGACFPFVAEIDPLPARRARWPGKRIELSRAPPATGGATLAEVLERRRSKRRYDATRPLSVHDLGVLLDRSARTDSVRTVPATGPFGQSCSYEVASRPYPSAGGSHELEIYPIVAKCDGLKPGIYHYDASHHALVGIPARDADVARIAADAKWASGDEADPQVVLAITARFARATWKYRSIGYANILRNTGALYQTLYLVATDLGLSPCALGAGNSALFARIAGLDPLVEGTVGEFLVGGPERPGAPEASLFAM